MVILTDQNFETEVLKSSLPVLVDFWAPWCGPCHMLSPIIEEIAGQYQGKVKVGKLDVDQNPQTAQKYSIMSIPTLIFFNKGQVVKQLLGVQTKDTLIKEISNF